MFIIDRMDNVNNPGRTMRDRLKNIQSRVSVGVRNYKNEQELRKKKTDFDNKLSSGEFKQYMLPRYQETVRLLQDIEKIPAPAVGPVTRGRPRKVGLPTVPEVEGPIAAPVPVAVGKTRKVKNSISLPANVGMNSNVNPFAPLPIQGTEHNNALAEASKGVVPTMYDPYTGRMFGPQENPLPTIEAA